MDSHVREFTQLNNISVKYVKYQVYVNYRTLTGSVEFSKL